MIHSVKIKKKEIKMIIIIMHKSVQLYNSTASFVKHMRFKLS